jgi:hypothetical protein
MLQEFYQMTIRKKVTGISKRFSLILTSGLKSIIISERIRGKCAAAEHQWAPLEMASDSEKREKYPEFDLTDTFSKSVTVRSNLNFKI